MGFQAAFVNFVNGVRSELHTLLIGVGLLFVVLKMVFRLPNRVNGIRQPEIVYSLRFTACVGVPI